jgi:hypothetical protein
VFLFPALARVTSRYVMLASLGEFLPVQPVGREEDQYPIPFLRPWPCGAAEVFIAAFVIVDLATLFVPKGMADP